MTHWSRAEVELIVDDYLAMLALELSGTPYNKSAHRRALRPKLNNRSERSIEWKHRNITAALIDSGLPFINGYKKLSNYQSLLVDVIGERLDEKPVIFELAEADADRPTVAPEIDDILSILSRKPEGRKRNSYAKDVSRRVLARGTNYFEREARNRSLGNAGEELVLVYERTRLLNAGKETLADRVEHTSKVRGDGAGYDILSFEETGQERLIEVKTTRYGQDTPFFVSRNEVNVSKEEAEIYQVYRLYDFRWSPRLYMLPGAIEWTCSLSPTTYLAMPQ